MLLTRYWYRYYWYWFWYCYWYLTWVTWYKICYWYWLWILILHLTLTSHILTIKHILIITRYHKSWSIIFTVYRLGTVTP